MLRKEERDKRDEIYEQIIKNYEPLIEEAESTGLIPEYEIKRHLTSLLLGLTHAHSEGMVHGNICPVSVVLHNGVAYLCRATNGLYVYKLVSQQLLNRSLWEAQLSSTSSSVHFISRAWSTGRGQPSTDRPFARRVPSAIQSCAP